MRTWLTSKQVAARLGVSRARVSQLHSAGAIVAKQDSEGVCMYDREHIEAFAQSRAAEIGDAQDERAKMREERLRAQQRAWRERREEKAIAEEREAARDDLLKRAVAALEKLAGTRTRSF